MTRHGKALTQEAVKSGIIASPAIMLSHRPLRSEVRRPVSSRPRNPGNTVLPSLIGHIAFGISIGWTSRASMARSRQPETEMPRHEQN